jgi:hypothetical protein
MSNTPNCGRTARQATGEPDPIFAAMERLQAARRGWLAAYDRLGVLQEMVPEARRRWQILCNERPNDCTDAPEWIEANTAFLAAIEELAKALEVVLSTPPTTITGVGDLLDYVGTYECQPLAREYPGTIVEYALAVKSVEGVKKAWANFLPMIAATLPRRVTGEPDPIFVAIERHRAALRGWLAADDRRGALWKMVPKARRRWEFDERPDDCTDAPEWIEANTALIEATEELDKALEVVLSTPPTTISGVAELLDYVSRYPWEVAGASEHSEQANECYGTILENALDGYSVDGVVEEAPGVAIALQKAAANFLPMIAATLRALTAGSS